MFQKSIVPVVALILTGAAALPFAARAETPQPPQMTEEKKQICEKAEQRYRKIYGRPSSDLLKDGIHVVKMYKYTFCPPQVTIRQGESVRWVPATRRISLSLRPALAVRRHDRQGDRQGEVTGRNCATCPSGPPGRAAAAFSAPVAPGPRIPPMRPPPRRRHPEPR